MDIKDILNIVLDIGEQMLISGAEVSRVENSIWRICKTYDAKRVDVFTITSSIVVTIQTEDGESYTQTRRISEYSTNLNKLDKLNDLSRYICAYKPDKAIIMDKLKEIDNEKHYSSTTSYFIYALIASAFTIFFGGTLIDGLVSAVIGVLLNAMIMIVRKADNNVVFINILCSLTVGVLTILAVHFGIGDNIEKIFIGNIMLLIPGLALTNAIRDIISGDTIAGLLRLFEALVIAISIAAGFGFSTFLFRGFM